jgi:7-keto-8-aminopelargonate synthetase-like enzyme
MQADGLLPPHEATRMQPSTHRHEVRMNIRKLLVTTALLAAATAAMAQSLEMRKRQADQDAELARLVALTDKSCGIDLKARIDGASFDADEFMQKSAVNWCAAALTAMENLCGDAMGKQAVAAGVKSLTCSGAPAVSVELSNGELKYAYPFSSASNANEQVIRTYLGKHL